MNVRRTLALYALAGAAIGSTFGVFIGAVSGHRLLGVGIGALAGLYVGWFVAAAVLERRKDRAADR